jgi:hypothetical protein
MARRGRPADGGRPADREADRAAGQAADPVEIAIRVTPRAARSAIDGVDDEGRLCLHITAPPVDGAANEAIIALLAAELGVRRSCVAIVSGTTSRHKRVRLAGVSRAALLTRWPRLGLGGRAID